jgi:hypothetical protein
MRENNDYDVSILTWRSHYLDWPPPTNADPQRYTWEQYWADAAIFSLETLVIYLLTLVAYRKAFRSGLKLDVFIVFSCLCKIWVRCCVETMDYCPDFSYPRHLDVLIYRVIILAGTVAVDAIFGMLIPFALLWLLGRYSLISKELSEMSPGIYLFFFVIFYCTWMLFNFS